jgi:hypothetical protein
MKSKLIWIIASLLVVALVVVVYFVYADSTKDRPTLMYFRADL